MPKLKDDNKKTNPGSKLIEILMGDPTKNVYSIMLAGIKQIGLQDATYFKSLGSK